MAILQVRNLPDPVYTRLKELAAEHRRSITQEAIFLLEEALGFDTSGRDRRNRMIDSLLEAGLNDRLRGGGPALPSPGEVIMRLRSARGAAE
jgi:plasmid stability protein